MWDLIVSFPDHCLSFYFVTGNYNFETGNITSILEYLKRAFLRKRMRGLILLNKGLKGKASIPDDRIPLVRRCRNDHSLAYEVPIANTDIYKCSFSPPPPPPRRPLGLKSLPDSLISPAEGVS